MAASLKICSRLLPAQVPHAISIRTAVVFERKFKVPLEKMDSDKRRRLRRKHMVYRVVEDKDLKRVPDIECVLTQHVDGLGMLGDVVTVKRSRFWRELGLSGAAVYATPENIELYSAQAVTAIKRTPHALQTYRLLCSMTLMVRMNPDVAWTLNQSHLHVAFRTASIHIENVDSIILPEEPITNKTSEQNPFTVKVKINGLDEAEVTCYIQPHSTDPKIMKELPSPPHMPLFEDRLETEKRLRELGVYYGTVS